MAKTSYTKKDLTKACATVKSLYTNKVRKGTCHEVSKTSVFSEIAKRLSLRSSRTLWRPKNEYREYLDTWYERFENDLKELQTSIYGTSGTPSKESTHHTSDNNKSNVELQGQGKKIKELENIIRTLRLENEALRLSKTERFGHIDNLNLLPESIDPAELTILYEYVSKLYTAMNK